MVKINFVGDVAVFKHFELNKIDPLGGVDLPESDFNVANLEFPLPSDSCKKAFYDVDENYRVSESFSKGLLISKFDLYSLANNHIMDYGYSGVEETIKTIQASGSDFFGVGYSGFNAKTVKINDIKFLFIGVVKKGRWDRVSNVFGPDSYKLNEVLECIKNFRDRCDHIIVFPHWGTELVDAPDPQDVKSARLMIECGASCVIGHHPHVSQGIERYKNGLIAYSLGSFIYLSEFEKGNLDKSPDRDVSICLSLTFGKDGIVDYCPYKYEFDQCTMLPLNVGEFFPSLHAQHLNSVIGDIGYYAKRIRSVLLLREYYSFVSRFKANPVSAIVHYIKYIKLSHFMKIFGK